MNETEMLQWQVESVAQAYEALSSEELAQWAETVHVSAFALNLGGE